MTAPATLVHASTVAIDGRAVLIEGPSGSGKSDLALRLIDRGALLVSDDYTELVPHAGGLVARAPATIVGRIEVRGVGMVTLLAAGDTPAALVVSLDAARQRLPEPAWREIAGVSLPMIALDPFAASAAIKVELALRHGLAA